MEKPTLLIGNKNYSSWSLRAWLVLHAFGVDFEEIQIKLFKEEAKPILQRYSPNGKVPVLIHQTQQGEQKIWDSLAIAEYANDYLILENAWGVNPAMARSMACEMHSGFFGLRNEMPMNIRATRKIEPSAQCLADIARIASLFADCRSAYGAGGDFLFGTFTIADAFYAPVVFRFQTYVEHAGVTLSPLMTAYMHAMRAHPSMQLWKTLALEETDIVSEDEAGVDV